MNTSSEICSKAEKFHTKHSIDLIIVDYLQLIQSAVPINRHLNRIQELSEISHNLKELAHELNVPVILVTHLSYDAGNSYTGIPHMSNLYECGSLLEDTDIVM